MKAILTRLFNHEELTSEETKQILLNITKEMYPEAQIAALLTAFQMRSITVDELIGFREALMETRLPIDFAPYNHPCCTHLFVETRMDRNLLEYSMCFTYIF